MPRKAQQAIDEVLATLPVEDRLSALLISIIERNPDALAVSLTMISATTKLLPRQCVIAPTCWSDVCVCQLDRIRAAVFSFARRLAYGPGFIPPGPKKRPGSLRRMCSARCQAALIRT